MSLRKKKYTPPKDMAEVKKRKKARMKEAEKRIRQRESKEAVKRKKKALDAMDQDFLDLVAEYKKEIDDEDRKRIEKEKESEKLAAFRRAQEARHVTPSYDAKVKVKVPEGGLTSKQVEEVYKLFKEPAGKWRVNTHRTEDGLYIKMIAPRETDAMTEINTVLKLKDMNALGSNPVEWIQSPTIVGDSVIFEVEVEAQRNY